jgi:hypothetical protein
MHPAHHLKFPSACPVLAGCDHSRVVNVLESAKPVLELLERADVVVMLHCLADILEPLKRARKLFETSGFSLRELQGELNVLQARLATLQDSAHSMRTFDGSYMQRLLEISNGLESSHGNIVLKWKEHSWTVILDSCEFDECVISDEVQMLIRDIQKQLDSRFPNKDTDLLNLFRIFDIMQMKYLKPSQPESYGVAELTEIIETLNQKDDGISAFFCQVPFIDLTDENKKNEVLQEWRSVREILYKYSRGNRATQDGAWRRVASEQPLHNIVHVYRLYMFVSGHSYSIC